VVWKVNAETPERASALAQQIFSACAARDLHLALVQLPLSWFEPASKAADNAGLMTCLRSVLMKPEHEAWMDQIWERLAASCAEVMGDYRS
jgi:hypothetical protein